MERWCRRLLLGIVGSAEEAAKESRRRAKADPENEKLGRQAEQAEGVAQAVRERVATRRRQRSKKAKDAKVSPSEPEAVFQPLKNKSIAPSYKPTLLANQERIIVGQQVQPPRRHVVWGLAQASEKDQRGSEATVTGCGIFVEK